MPGGGGYDKHSGSHFSELSTDGGTAKTKKQTKKQKNQITFIMIQTHKRFKKEEEKSFY